VLKLPKITGKTNIYSLKKRKHHFFDPKSFIPSKKAIVGPDSIGKRRFHRPELPIEVFTEPSQKGRRRVILKSKERYLLWLLVETSPGGHLQQTKFHPVKNRRGSVQTFSQAISEQQIKN
jgi:hypothetical protein